MDSVHTKVFGIGLSKTGTHSLTTAMKILGYRAVHFDFTRHVLQYSETGLEVDYSLFDEHDAFFDTPVTVIYQELDRRYPGSRFILTVRDPQKWARSFQNQFAKKELDHYSRHLHMDLYGTISIDPVDTMPAYTRHQTEVLEYFRDRPDDLLVMDITSGDGWELLCPFLDTPIPDQPFPKDFTKWQRKRRKATWPRYFLLGADQLPGRIIRRLLKKIRSGDG